MNLTSPYKYILANTSFPLEQYDGSKYSVLRLSRLMTMAQRINNHFTCIVSFNTIGWQYACMDFITYENYHGRTVIAFLTKEQMDEVLDIYGISTFKDKWLREHEPTILVHSTLLDFWHKILEDKKLVSFRNLSNYLEKNLGLGYYLLNEPIDYADYIMLCSMTDPVGELVVATREQRKIINDVKTIFTPGVRLYFNAKLIAQDGLLVRDGTHYKVKEQLPLDKYLVDFVIVEKLSSTGYKYSIMDFIRLSNEYFNSKNCMCDMANC